MFTLRDSAGPDTLDQHLRFLVLSLTDRPETADLRAELAFHLTELRGAVSTARDARDARVAASNRLRYRDAQLDDEVAQLSHRLLAEVRKDREHPRYRAVFPRNTSEAMAELATTAQEQYVRRAIAAARLDAAAEALEPQTARVEAALSTLTAAVSERAALSSAEAAADTRLGLVFNAARDAFNLAYPKLQVAYPGEKALVRSFYYQATET